MVKYKSMLDIGVLLFVVMSGLAIRGKRMTDSSKGADPPKI